MGKSVRLLHIAVCLSVLQHVIVSGVAVLLLCSEPMWPIEARCAAIANTYFVGAINRVGTVSGVGL